MPRQNIRSRKRTRNLIFVVAMSAIILSVSTYAWFIGMRTVNVQSFDVEIAGTESLWLSFDGKNWGSTIKFDEATLQQIETEYATNTNSWTTEGLIPMSSIGQMDTNASRMMLFEKASLTTTNGGYRLLASRVKNYEVGSSEQDGYVVFDLFVRNFSGTQYIVGENQADEEAIYLTNDSSVKVSTAGGVENTGIENSVRLGFAQIGRVVGTTAETARTPGDGQAAAVSLIQGITCTTDTDVTGLCRTAQIWEPNDTNHNVNAISWYSTSCRKRIGATASAASYDKAIACNEVIDGIAYPTYAVRKAITSADAVDVYDGAAYNTFTGTVASSLATLVDPVQDGKDLLYSYNYFTDTKKLLTGTSRPQFMSLAPNSVTKLRVYVYIEGQDVDNYDFASIGKKISVKFGFTKERYTEDDIKYEGPNLNQGEGPNGSDITAPVITLEDGTTPGSSTVNLTLGEAYVEPGFSASDKIDAETSNDVTGSVIVTGTVNTNKAGTYYKVYTVKDASGNTATKTRTIIVE